MLNNNYNLQKIHVIALSILLISSILIGVAYFYLDYPVAEFVNYYHFPQYEFFKLIIRFPELLIVAAFFTIIGLILSFVSHPYFTPLKVKLFALSIGLMTSYAIKDILKYAFSRVGFYFFHGGYAYGSFPSGHTTIPFFVAAVLWYQMPSWRPFLFIIPLLVAVGLVATNNHFLSDVIGGAGLGIITGFYAYYFSNIEKK